VSIGLPSWINEQTLGIGAGLMAGQKLNFPETSRTVPIDIAEISPHTVLFASRLWEGTASTMQKKTDNASWINRFIFQSFLKIGYRVGGLRAEGKRPNLFWSSLYAFANMAVFRPIKSKHGLHKVRTAYTGGATLSPDVIRFFVAIGINLRQLFGLTETALVAAEKASDTKPGTVGKPLQGVVVDISDQGEILVGKDSCFLGYYKDPGLTQDVLANGWLHTGDAGYFDEDGYLVFQDKLEDMRQLIDGTRFSPQHMESRLRFNPFITDAFVLGGKERGFVGAILTIDTDYVVRWAEKESLPHCTFVDLVQTKA
ncbi:MAG: long-chain fatty acid--CoA ligase, partial [Desulfobacteraceae bacterium]|nr:long-chain fatty acid--CoA ligase [Desulfobacteraceae bacterium]